MYECARLEDELNENLIFIKNQVRGNLRLLRKRINEMRRSQRSKVSAIRECEKLILL